MHKSWLKVNGKKTIENGQFINDHKLRKWAVIQIIIGARLRLKDRLL